MRRLFREQGAEDGSPCKTFIEADSSCRIEKASDQEDELLRWLWSGRGTQ